MSFQLFQPGVVLLGSPASFADRGTFGIDADDNVIHQAKPAAKFGTKGLAHGKSILPGGGKVKA